MDQNIRGYSLKISIELVLLAGIYFALVFLLHNLTGNRQLDGTVGIVLGLFICSHPTGNILDILIYRRNTLRPDGWSWLLNFLVFFIGWLVIFVGATRFTIGGG